MSPDNPLNGKELDELYAGDEQTPKVEDFVKLSLEQWFHEHVRQGDNIITYKKGSSVRIKNRTNNREFVFNTNAFD